jgi:hypothetical protein
MSPALRKLKTLVDHPDAPSTIFITRAEGNAILTELEIANGRVKKVREMLTHQARRARELLQMIGGEE